MAPNNALGKPTAARLREREEGLARPSSSPRRRAARARQEDDVRVANADAFGAGDTSVLYVSDGLTTRGRLCATPALAFFPLGRSDRSEVTSRGTGTAVRTPLDEFEARPRDELRCLWTGVMFLTRLPCPGWCGIALKTAVAQRHAAGTPLLRPRPLDGRAATLLQPVMVVGCLTS